MKFHVFSTTIFCYEMVSDKLENGVEHAIKWRPIS